jgi:hypothetical protein
VTLGRALVSESFSGLISISGAKNFKEIYKQLLNSSFKREAFG